MKCRICNNEAEFKFAHKVMNKYNVDYYCCPNCSFVFTEDPYWLEEAYKDPINIYDTGIISRNLYFSKVLSSVIFLLFDKKKRFLDYAGGYGILTRLMRDIGFNFYWDDKHTKNILAKGFELKTAKHEKFEILTTFEVFEHLADPVEEIRKMLELSSNIIFSTEILPLPVPDPESWWYYEFNHGQHVSFYSLRTLKVIAEKYSLNFYSSGVIHLFTKKPLNPFIFYLIVKLAKYGLASAVSLFMKSKMWEDYFYLKNASSNE